MVSSKVDKSSMGTTEAFELLSDETQLAILLTLLEVAEPFTEESWNTQSEANAVLSDLLNCVGMSDSDQFTFHLNKLDGCFVEHTSDAYSG